MGRGVGITDGSVGGAGTEWLVRDFWCGLRRHRQECLCYLKRDSSLQRPTHLLGSEWGIESLPVSLGMTLGGVGWVLTMRRVRATNELTRAELAVGIVVLAIMLLLVGLDHP
jgi:hypothetical protein